MQIEDNGSVERQIQSVFDFLEETDSGCEYWGVNQRRSHSLDDEEEPGNHEEHKESSDEEVSSVLRNCRCRFLDMLMMWGGGLFGNTRTRLDFIFYFIEMSEVQEKWQNVC